MKAVVAAFNQEKALVGAFSVIVKSDCGTDGSFYSTSTYWLLLELSLFELLSNWADALAEWFDKGQRIYVLFPRPLDKYLTGKVQNVLLYMILQQKQQKSQVFRQNGSWFDLLSTSAEKNSRKEMNNWVKATFTWWHETYMTSQSGCNLLNFNLVLSCTIFQSSFEALTRHYYCLYISRQRRMVSPSC